MNDDLLDRVNGVWLRMIEAEMPDFHEMVEELARIEAETARIETGVSQRELEAGAARRLLIPLLKRRGEILNGSDYQACRKIAEACSLRPEYRDKVEEALGPAMLLQ